MLDKIKKDGNMSALKVAPDGYVQLGEMLAIDARKLKNFLRLYDNYNYKGGEKRIDEI
jgi:hypothetical protein